MSSESQTPHASPSCAVSEAISGTTLCGSPLATGGGTPTPATHATGSLTRLTPDARAWLTESISRAGAMGVRYEEPETLQRLYDSAHAECGPDTETRTDSAADRSRRSDGMDLKRGVDNDVIGVIAAALGELLARRHDFDWYIRLNESYSEVCLHDQRSGVTLTPLRIVAEHWDNDATAWVGCFLEQIARDVRQFSAAGENRVTEDEDPALTYAS